MEFTGERFIPDCGLDSEIELEHLQRYLAVQNVVTGKRVLDVASGVGYGSALLAEKAGKVCGVDIDYEAVAFAKKHYEAANLRYFQGSIISLPFPDNSFDVVVSFETIEHVVDGLHKKFLDEVLRVLSPEGFLIISTPDKHIYSELANYENEFHVREYYRQEFVDFLGQFFSEVVLLDQLQELAHIITDNSEGVCRVLRHGTALLPGKYLIALCGFRNLPDSGDMNSVMFDYKRSYQKKVDRVVELQGEIIEKNGNIADCWKMIHERDDIIEQKTHELNQEKYELARQRKKYLELDDQMAAKERKNRHLHLELDENLEKVSKLSASLEHIYSTRAWKIVQKIYWLKNQLWS